MKFIITLFLSLFLATYAFSYSLSFFGQNLVNKNYYCDNTTDWKNYFDKAKKEHPSAEERDLVKFIANDLMKDSADPILTGAVHVIEDKKDLNNSHFTCYIEIYGSFEEINTLMNRRIRHCDFEKKFELLMITRTKKSENGFSLFSWLRNFIFQKSHIHERTSRTLLKKQIHEYFVFKKGPKTSVSCAEIPKVQAIIEKMKNMSMPNVDQWTREFVEELKATIKPRNSMVLKANMGIDKMSVISEGTGTVREQNYCFDNPSDIKCIHCSDDSDFLDVYYYEK